MPQTPSILRRYMSTFIDIVFILSVFIAVSFVATGDSAFASLTRISILFFMIFIYEPVFTSRFCTLGQKIMGIRVRNIDTYKHISIPAAYLRYAVKMVLGFYSFISIPSSKQRRALHDFATDTIVIMA